MGRNFTIYISDERLCEKIDALKSQGINISKICVNALDNLSKRSMRDIIEEKDIKDVKTEIKFLNKELNELKDKTNKIIQNADEEAEMKIFQLNILYDHLEELMKLRQAEIIAERTSRTFRKLNEICVEHDFDYETIEIVTKNLVKELRKIKKDFDLKVHIERLQNLLR